MGRKRKKGNEKLPTYVYLTKGRYVYRPYEKGKLGREVRLCDADATMVELWSAYEEIQGVTRDNFKWLGQLYLDSSDFRSKAESTRGEYLRMFGRIVARRMQSGRLFGDLPLEAISVVVIRKYMDRYGPGREMAANRELSFMAGLFAWGYERGKCKTNPCRGVKKFKETPRSHYATDEDYKLVYDLACKFPRRPYLPIAMEIAYLCRARRIEVVNLRESDISSEGLLIRRRKGSKTQVVGWTPRLRAAVDAALALPGIARIDPKHRWLIHDKQGDRIHHETLGRAWQELMARAVKQGLKHRFTFHDLKRKSVTDFEGDKLKASGHRSPQMLEVYDVSIEVVEATR